MKTQNDEAVNGSGQGWTGNADANPQQYTGAPIFSKGNEGGQQSSTGVPPTMPPAYPAGGYENQEPGNMPNMAPQYQQPQKKYLGMAIAAFVVSFFSGLIGLIIAIMAQVKLSKEKGRYKGQGLNIAAFVISGINLVLSIILSVAFTSGVLQGTREALEGSAASSSQTRSHHDAHSERSKDQGADSGKADSQSAGRYADVQAWVDAHPENFKDFHDADGQLTSKVTGQGNDTLMIDMTTQADFNGQIDDATKAKIDEQMGKAVSIMVPAIEQDVIQLRAAGFPNAVAKVVVHIGSTYSYNATVDDKGMVQS